MKPHVYLTCSNSECTLYDKEVEPQEDGGKWLFNSPYCSACHHEGRLRIVHKGIEAESSEAFYAKVGGMAKEFHLLKKLIAKDVAELEDQARYTEILDQIEELECTGCGQKLINHEHA